MPESPTGHVPSGCALVPTDTVGEGPAVMFVHAGVADRRMWDPQFAAVPDGFRFVRIDLRGHGSCELGESPFSNHDDVLAVLDHLHIDDAGDLARVAELDAEIWVVGHGRTVEDVDRRVLDLVAEMDRTAIANETRRAE